MLDTDAPRVPGRIVAAHEQIAAGLDAHICVHFQLARGEIDSQTFGDSVEIKDQRPAQLDGACEAVELDVSEGDVGIDRRVDRLASSVVGVESELLETVEAIYTP